MTIFVTRCHVDDNEHDVESRRRYDVELSMSWCGNIGQRDDVKLSVLLTNYTVTNDLET